MNYQIYLKDTVTGEVKAIDYNDRYHYHPDGPDEGIRWIWEQGGYSTDQNRADYFYPEDNETEWQQSSCTRFNLQRIVNVSRGHDVALVYPERVE